MFVRTRSATAWLWAGALAIGAIGCGDSSVSEIASSVKDAAQGGIDKMKDSGASIAEQAKQEVADAAASVTGTVSEGMQLAGTMKLLLDQPIEPAACYVTLVAPQAGRPGVLQLQSYRDAKNETFPSVLLHAQVASANVSELTGQTVASQMFVQTQQDGPVWFTKTEPVQLKIVSVEEKKLAAEVVSGSLFNTGNGTTHAVSGQLDGVLP